MQGILSKGRFLIVIVIVFIAKKQKLRIQGFRGTLFSDKHIFC